MLFRLLVVALLIASPAYADPGEATPWIGLAVAPGVATHGVKVNNVIGGSPGEHAGLHSGDEVVAIDGVTLTSPTDLITRVRAKGVGTVVMLDVRRDGKALSVTLALVARPDQLQLMRDHLLDRPAPAFALAEARGDFPASTAALAGDVVVVEFFATWCGPCNASIPRLSAWQKTYGGRGLRVIGVSTEPLDLLARHKVERQMGYTVAHDPGETSGAYLVPAVPTFVVVGRDGKVRHVEVGAGDNVDAVEAAFLPLLNAAK